MNIQFKNRESATQAVQQYIVSNHIPAFTITGPGGLIDKIYDHFEQIVCENCYYLKQDKCPINNLLQDSSSILGHGLSCQSFQPKGK